MPDSGIKYFLNSQADSSSWFILEAITVIAQQRTKFLQDNLNENNPKVKMLKQRNNKLFGRDCKERTVS